MKIPILSSFDIHWYKIKPNLYDHRTVLFFEDKKVLNDFFGNKPFTFQMPRNNVNFEVTPLYTLTQRNCIRKTEMAFRLKVYIVVP